MADGTTLTSTSMGPYSIDQIVNAIRMQESGGSKNPNLTSGAGAIGPMQIIQPTFNRYAQPGESITNYADNLAVGRRIIADYYNRFGGDPGRIATAYYSGEGNVNTGTGSPYVKNSAFGGKTTASYVSDIYGRLGTTPPTEVASAASSKPTIGGAIAALSAPTGADQKGPSTFEQLEKTFGGGQQQAGAGAGGGAPAPQMDLQGQMAAGMGNPRQQQIAMQAQQMALALQQKNAVPPMPGMGSAPWGSKPAQPGYSFLGGQFIPGTTLNSYGG